jgi:hypothetical protein
MRDITGFALAQGGFAFLVGVYIAFITWKDSLEQRPRTLFTGLTVALAVGLTECGLSLIGPSWALGVSIFNVAVVCLAVIGGFIGLFVC